ncbi:hypothetical protein PMIN04_006265 [Paraphaeosphaeria minitans]
MPRCRKREISRKCLCKQPLFKQGSGPMVQQRVELEMTLVLDAVHRHICECHSTSQMMHPRSAKRWPVNMLRRQLEEKSNPFYRCIYLHIFGETFAAAAIANSQSSPRRFGHR